MLREIEILSSAKINLCLNVEGKDDIGFHNLDSIVANVPIYDRIIFTERNDSEKRLSYVNGESFMDDVSMRMVRLIDEAYGLPGVDIVIEKHIPVGAGLGGSSADAAGIARGLKALFNLGEIPNSLLISVGSDIPCMYYGGNTRMQGRGEKITPITLPSDLYVSLLVDRSILLHTGRVFKRYDEVGGEAGNVDSFLKFLIPFNSLEKAAIDICPQVSNLKELLERSGYGRVVMTGSGSAFLGFTPDNTAFQGISALVENEARNKGFLHYRFKISSGVKISKKKG
ncbi:MAG: hypothetical protein WCY33_04250 [Clostridia bacterium]